MIRWILILLCSTSAFGQETRVRVDGLFQDWTAEDLRATDPAGDASGAFDVTKIHARAEGSRLYLRFDIGTVLNIQSGKKTDDTVAFSLKVAESPAVIVDMRARRAVFEDDPDVALIWRDLDFMMAPTFASSEFEFQIDLKEQGAKEGAEVSVQLSGSDSLDKPFRVRFGPARAPRPERSTDRASGTDIRIASFNTLRSGLQDPKRARVIRRLIEAVDADILCFQEEYDLKKPARVLRQALGGKWNTALNRDCLTASRYPVIPINAKLGRSCVCLVMTPKTPVLVINTHPHAAGYIGNKNDRKRVTEMTRMADFLVSFKKGSFDGKLKKYRFAPAVVVGDWNLVGSRTPLDLLLSEKGPAMKDHLLEHLVGESTATWREVGEKAKRGGGFAPGRLDLLCSTPDRLRFLKGFVLETTDLKPATLRKLGLRKDDSQISDHLLLAADFSLRSF